MTGLAAAWLETARAVGARGDVAGAGADLLSRWAEPHRRYHDLAHLAAVLAHVDELAGEASDVEAVRLAAWFHDAVYDPSAPDNEASSARLARVVLRRLDVDDARVGSVVRLVLLTATHDPDPDDRDGAVLCDADLAVLARPAAAYERYVAAVRAEYAHVDDSGFASGRSEVLRSLLERPALFRTARGRTAWEGAARANLAAELAGYG